MSPAQEASFTAFVRERGATLLRYARMLCAGDAEAEDVLQVALLRLARHWPRGLDAPEAYARRAVLNAVRDRARRHHLIPVPSGGATSAGRADAAHPPGEAGSGERLDHLLGMLPPRQRAAVVLRVIEGLSEMETAVAMGCSAGTAKSNLSRGLAKLRAVMAVPAALDEGARR
jgi:RNA polymerase sigma factor (sigma-70 family)